MDEEALEVAVDAFCASLVAQGYSSPDIEYPPEDLKVAIKAAFESQKKDVT